MLPHQLAWLVVAAGVVVEDRGYTSTSTVYAALDLGPQRFVVSVALKATPAEIETTATTFCREHRADIASLAPGIDGAWAADACAGLVRGAIRDRRASSSRTARWPSSTLVVMMMTGAAASRSRPWRRRPRALDASWPR